MSTRLRRSKLAGAVALALGAYGASTAYAAGPIEEVVVTGSYIRGTPEDAALPVDVITADELYKRGSPNMLDIIRAMPYVTGIMGETNQFGPNQGTIGVGNVNLRGLGGMRTLVLMNGRRTTYTPAEGPTGVDTNLLPIAAMGRVEVLKDGAAATYGSDAIAGVVNFITRRDLEGIEVNAKYRGIEDSGAWNGSVNWGWVGDRANVLLSYAQQHRDQLKSTDRDWAFPDYLTNPTGWSILGMPGTFIPRTAPEPGAIFGTPVAGNTIDANCTDLGGYRDPSSCRFSFVPFDNLVEKTEQQQFYGEVNFAVTDNVEFHFEALYAETRLPEYRTSPGYPPTSGPFGPGTFQFSVLSNPECVTAFCNNPGAVTALGQSSLPGAVQDATRQMQLFLWRPHGWGGVPDLTGGNGGQLNKNYFDMGRVSAGLKGTFQTGWAEGIGWDVAATYSRSEHTRSGVDNMISRLQNALNGLGGADCNGIAFGLPGSTCQYYNPFSNAIPFNSALGLTNPGHVAANANSAEIKDWMIERWNVIQDQSLMVLDAVLDGQIGGFELPGGQIGWAVGAQYREIHYETRVDNPLTDANVTPCPIPGDSSCVIKTGPFIFLGQFIPQRLSDTVYAAFAELAIPILDNLDVQLAVRYEDYGGETGDTLDPKLSVRWQATDWLAFRGSAGSTFRGPTPVNKSLRATGLQPVSATGGQYKSIDNVGSPLLTPESADTFSAGVIFQLGGFEAIVDYWRYEFKDQITTVPFNAIANAVGNGPGTGAQLANCDHPLRYLITFDNNNTCTQGTTTALQMQRITVNVVNGSPVDISGFDASVKYDFGEVLGGELMVGIDATIFDEYKQSGFTFGGARIFNDYDAVGFTNQERNPGSVSKMRAIGHANFAMGGVNARYEVRYVEGLRDDRNIRPDGSVVLPTVVDATGVARPISFGNKVDDYWVHNLHLNWDAPWETQVSFSIVNLFDEDPPGVRHQLSYDPYIGDPLGRTWEVGFRKTFSMR
jgi:iron complex outermembrane recepter protein